MWIVNEDGFFSITSGNPEDYRKLNASMDDAVVRARDHVSLVMMKRKLDGPDPEIVGPWPDADYRYRMAIDKLQLAKYLFDYATEDLTYVSFKDGVKARWWYLPRRIQHAREVALIDIWAAARTTWCAPGWADYPEDTLECDILHENVAKAQSGKRICNTNND